MTDTLLLDTNIVSFLIRKDDRAEALKPILKGKVLYLSFMSVAELYRWAVSRNWGPGRISRLDKILDSYVILPYDRELAWTWANVVDTCARQGARVPPSDAWIAATACRYNVPLLTHNQKDFEAVQMYCGLNLVTLDG